MIGVHVCSMGNGWCMTMQAWESCWIAAPWTACWTLMPTLPCSLAGLTTATPGTPLPCSGSSTLHTLAALHTLVLYYMHLPLLGIVMPLSHTPSVVYVVQSRATLLVHSKQCTCPSSHSLATVHTLHLTMLKPLCASGKLRMHQK